MAEPYVRPTAYEVSLLPGDDVNQHLYAIEVQYRGDDRWAVVRHGFCLGTDGVWDFGVKEYDRGDDWLSAHRFDLDTALGLAKKAAPDVTVNGITALEVYRRNPPQHLGGGANAEDCPACHGTNPPYPFICPGPVAKDGVQTPPEARA